VRDEARKFAAQGYTAFVADMYGDAKTADDPKDAGALSGAVRKNPAVMQSRFNAAKDVLSKHATVDAAKIGASGSCFGGAVVLDMARSGADLKGVAAFPCQPGCRRACRGPRHGQSDGAGASSPP
jgi:dienelactone hydrolase